MSDDLGPRIERVDLHLLRQPLQQPLGLAHRWLTRRETVLVAVRADDGTVGWGEAGGTAAVSASVTAAAVREFLGPRLLGQTIWRTQPIFTDLSALIGGEAGPGPYLDGLSAIDLALWDLKAKALGVNLGLLLGGRQTDVTLAAGHALYYHRGDGLAGLTDEARRMADEGFQTVEMQVGKGLRTDLDRLRAVRRGGGDRLTIGLAGHGGMTAREAIALGLHAAAEGAAWLAEPVPTHDTEAWQAVHAALAPQGLALAGGRGHSLPGALHALIARRAIDYIDLDLVRCGGHTGAQGILAAAQAAGLEVRLFVQGAAISLAHALQRAATLPSLPTPRLIVDCHHNHLMADLLPDFPRYDGAQVCIPAGLGLGHAPSEAELAPFA